MNTLDLLVIGAGLSGLTAAHTAAKAGLKVQVIAKGLGALHWSAGTIDLFGYTPAEHDHPVRRPFEAIDQLAASLKTMPRDGPSGAGAVTAPAASGSLRYSNSSATPTTA